MIPSLNQKPTVSFGHIYTTNSHRKAIKKICELFDKFPRNATKQNEINMLPVQVGNKIKYYVFAGKFLADFKKIGCDIQKLPKFIKKQLKKGAKFYNLDK